MENNVENVAIDKKRMYFDYLLNGKYFKCYKNNFVVDTTVVYFQNIIQNL